MRKGLSGEQRKWAVVGARARRVELKAELAALDAFLASDDGKVSRQAKPSAVAVTAKAKPVSGKRTMSRKQRAAVSARMKRYWASRRAAKAKAAA